MGSGFWLFWKHAGWIQASRSTVLFTGAGISTSSGLPDYRGPRGKWAMQAAKKAMPKVPTLPLCSDSHMAIVALEQANLASAIVSQNTDGLHARSGIDPSKLAELHGNTNREICPRARCGAVHYRSFRCREPKNAVNDHRTRRKCSACGNTLHDSIVNFGEGLPQQELERGEAACLNADLIISLGTSLQVTPAADLPKLAKQNRNTRLVVVNLQPTPLDEIADLLISADVRQDVLVPLTREYIGLRIPEYVFEQQLQIVLLKHTKKENVHKLKLIMPYSGDSELALATTLRSANITFGSYSSPVRLDADNAWTVQMHNNYAPQPSRRGMHIHVKLSTNLGAFREVEFKEMLQSCQMHVGKHGVASMSACGAVVYRNSSDSLEWHPCDVPA